MKPKQQEETRKATCRPTQGHWHQMNRKQRREMMRRIQSENLSLEVIHPDAAGIDIGNESHYVAVPPTRDSEPVRRFGCTTAELKSMADWLKQCRIRTVAMQSTGVYWIAVFDILEEAHQLVPLQQMAELQDGALVRRRRTPQIDSHEPRKTGDSYSASSAPGSLRLNHCCRKYVRNMMPSPTGGRPFSPFG